MNKIIPIDIQNRTNKLIDELTDIWENSVYSTHLFLTKTDIKNIKTEVITGLKQIPVLLISYADDKPIGFAGISNNKLEMLFLSPNYFNKGFGTKLIKKCFNDYNINYVDVNEQNSKALKFYQKQGFEIFNRSELDSSNRPFPILHLKKLY